MSKIKEATEMLIKATGSRKKAQEMLNECAKEIEAGAHDGHIGMFLAKKRNKSGKLND